MKRENINQSLKVAEIKLTYKTRIPASERPKVRCSIDAFEILIASWDKDTIEHVEEFKVLLLNRSNKVLGLHNLSKGGVSGTITDAKVIFQAALKSNASALIIAHNHPSGSLDASDADIRLTKKICAGAKLLDISVLDHLIITPEETYKSLSDSGQMGV